MRKYFFFLPLMALAACQESLVDRAETDAREYTQKYCPTPAMQSMRNDSVTFDRSTLTFCYHYSALDLLDNAEVMNHFADKLAESLRINVADNTNLKVYKKAGYSFRYVMRSAKDPQRVLFETTITEADYSR